MNLEKKPDLNKTFCVVEFEDGLEVIRTEWANFEENDSQITSCYFPPAHDRVELTKILNTARAKITKQWCNVDGNPYPVTFYRSVDALEAAYEVLTLLKELSGVSSDDGKNEEIMRKSRRDRKRKTFGDDYVEPDRVNLTMKTTFIPKPTIDNLKSRMPCNNKNAGETSQHGESDKFAGGCDDTATSEIVIDSRNSISNLDDQVAEHSPSSFDSGIEQDFQNSTLNLDSSETQQNKEQVVEPTPSGSNTKTKNDRTKSRKRRSRFEDNPADLEKWQLEEKEIYLLKKINYVGFIVEDIRRGTNVYEPIENSDVINFATGNDTSSFPVNTLAEIEDIEVDLLDETFKDKVTASLVRLGASGTLSLTVKRFLSLLITNEGGKVFTFVGRGAKKSFKKSKLYDVIIDSVGRLFPREQISNMDKWIEDWLTQSNGRIKREAEKKKKKADQEKAQTLPPDNPKN